MQRKLHWQSGELLKSLSVQIQGVIMEKKYYVYEWFIISSGEIFYVGKGSGNRYRVTNGRNKLFNDILSHNKCESRIIQFFENEAEAFRFEDERIQELKALGQCSCNLHSGGAGGSGEYWTPVLREEYSLTNVMKRPEQRLRMSTNNPMKNSEIAKQVSAQKKRPVIINNIEYDSIKTACEKYNVPSDTMINWCHRGINYYGEQCRYKDEDQPIFTGKRYNKGGSKAVIYKDKIYEAVIDLCHDIGISQRACSEWLKRGFDPNGEPCRYVGDKKEYTYENRYVLRNKRRAKPIIVNGIKYSSCQEAAKILNKPKSTLYSYLNGTKNNPNYICTYDNQQPSQENSENSILEGSTTNG